MGMTLEEARKHPKLRQYVELLLEWNAGMNLIGKSTVETVWEEHIGESLFLLPELEKEELNTVFDIGSGGGMPGLILAALLPEKHFTVTDVDSKKLAFLKFAVKKLGLQTDVADMNQPQAWETECAITARAFSETRNIMAWAARHTPNARRFYLLKGARPNTEAEVAASAKIYPANYEITDLPKGTLLKVVL